MKLFFFFFKEEEQQHNLTFLEGSQTGLLVMRGSNFCQGNSIEKNNYKASGNSESIKVSNCLKKIRKRIFYAVLQ